MAEEPSYDLVILGSGSTAFAAALRAQEFGKTAVLIEERTTGGTCVNRGCLPSKNLIEAARIVHEASHPRYPGLKPAKLEFDFEQLIAQKDEIIRDYRRKKYESLVGGKIAIEHGHAEFLDPQTIIVNGQKLRGARILIATGSRPVIPDIEGLDRVPYLTSDLLTSDEPSELRSLPRSLIIIGGGYIALELGQMFRRFGARVTILEQSAKLLPRGFEPEVGPTIQQIFAEEGIDVVTGARALSVERLDDGVRVLARVGGEGRAFCAEKLLVATGRRPNTDRLALERAGVAADESGQIIVNEYLQTSVPHIFAAGDVIGAQRGSQMATPVGSHDGGIAAHNALAVGPMRTVDHRVIPRAIFTDPQVATVGLTEEEARKAGHRCWCGLVPMSLVPRAGIIRDARGFIKMVADVQTGEVLGVTMVGHNAGEVIHEAAMALRFRAKLDDFVDLLHVYPTMAEALKIAAISRRKNPAKLSCCAE
ncbi:MAG: mercury(II) reductase [Pyrinomonas methylaliphatogenes]|nr:mercury(II) reductase [Pyrinomonas methylaliphatogenes]